MIQTQEKTSTTFTVVDMRPSEAERMRRSYEEVAKFYASGVPGRWRVHEKTGYPYHADAPLELSNEDAALELAYRFVMKHVADIDDKSLSLALISPEGDAFYFASHQLLQMITSDECNYCEGTGVEECFHCGSETDCDYCDGTGQLSEPRVLTRTEIAQKFGRPLPKESKEPSLV